MSKNFPSETISSHLSDRQQFLRPPISHKSDWLAALFIGSVHALIVTLVYHYVPDSYMDEIFHVRQTQRYCDGDYRWDPMITTPPALYIIAMPFCGGFERYINSLLIALAFPGFCRFRRMFVRSSTLMTCLAAACLPVLLHSSSLFYTDLLSVGCVVWAMSLPSPILSASVFLVACLTRQTNIVWAGLYALVRMYHRFDHTRPVRSLLSSVIKLWPFVLLAISFVFFVFVNGGIVLGDPSAHHPRVHLAQFFYLCMFCAIHAWPQSLPHIQSLMSQSLGPFGLSLLPIAAVCVHYCSFDHPYLLADNRHVPFYLWRWWLSVPSKRLALVPLYAASILFLNHLSSRIPVIVRVLFTLSTLAVVVPAHLIEPRYFIIPYVLWRLSAKTSTSLIVNTLEIASQVAVFTGIFYLFLFKPFEWANEPGVKQRFMW